jgi:RNA polymerase sigma-70 factor (ECF subfamily)
MNDASATTSSGPDASDCATESTSCDPAERELIREALDGSASASREIVKLHQRRIFSFISRMTRQPQDAEDITQETFIKAFRSLHRFDTRRPLVNWLFTIARRTALNHFRSARNWVSLPEDTASPQLSPASRVEESDQIDDLWERARRELAPREFEVMWLRFGENLSIEETARITGLTNSNIKILVFRSRQRMLQTTAQP